MTLQQIDAPLAIVERDGTAPQDIQREAQQRAVLEALANGASYQKAADAAGITRRTLHNWKTGDEEFAQLVADAIDAGVDLLEDEAHRRANGWMEDIYYEGEVVGRKFVASDRLMEFMLSGRRPEKFRQKTATTVNVDARNQTAVTLAPEALEILQRIANASGGNYDRGKGEEK